MTREEAIETLRNTAWLGTDKKVGQVEEAIQIAIKALEAQDVDAVSRQAVMWMLTNLSYNQCKTQGEADVIDTAKTMVMTMPSAQSEKVQLSQEDATFDTSTGIIDRPTNAPTDCISRQAAIDAVYKCANIFINNLPVMVDKADAYKALAELPSAQPKSCEDAVSKADVLETYADLYDVFEDNKQIIKELHRVYDKLNALPSAQPERTCVNCGRTANNGGWYADGGTRCPIEEHYTLPKDGYCHLWEQRSVTDDDYPERREE